MHNLRYIPSALALLAASCGTDHPTAQQPAATPPTSPVGPAKPALKLVFADSAYQLTGVAAAGGGRVFVNYPYWLEKHRYSVVKVDPAGKPRPYPDAAWNSFKKGDDGTSTPTALPSPPIKRGYTISH